MLKNHRKLKLIGIAAIVIIAAVGGYYLYTLTPGAKAAKAARETDALVATVGKMIILPSDDKPAVFDVADPSLLSSQQAFFANAEKGDKLLVFSKSARAIIYSPARRIIVNVGPVSLGDTAASAAQK